MIEEKVAQTLLEEPQIVTIGGVAYKVAPPSIATLVRASKYISQIPTDTINSENPFGSILHNAEQYENIAWAIAAIVLGEAFEKVQETRGKRPKSKFAFWKKESPLPLPSQTQGQALAKVLMNTDIREVTEVFFKTLGQMDIKSFFVVTTSLKGMNLIAPTKEVARETTVSGGS